MQISTKDINILSLRHSQSRPMDILNYKIGFGVSVKTESERL